MDRIRNLKNIILLGMAYYFILGPIALLLKLFRIKPLDPRRKKTTSFWDDRKEEEKKG